MGLGWLFVGGLIVPSLLPLVLWRSHRLDGGRAWAMGASLWALWFGAVFVHLSGLAWLGEGREYHALSGVCALTGGLLGMIGTWASMPRGVRSLLYGLAGLLLLPLLGSFSLFPLGFVLTPVAVGTFWVLAFSGGRESRTNGPPSYGGG